jgi:hypothetical protein
MKDTIKDISEITPPSASEDIAAAARVSEFLRRQYDTFQELTMSLLQVVKSEEKNLLLGEVQYTSSKFESLINHCASSLSSNEKQEMIQFCSKISITVKQFITYTEYGQPIDSALEVLTREIRGVVAFSQRHFSKNKQ